MRNQQRWDRLLLGVDSMPLATGINLVDVSGQYRIGDGSEIVRYSIATPVITSESRRRGNRVIHISIHADGRLCPFPSWDTKKTSPVRADALTGEVCATRRRGASVGHLMTLVTRPEPTVRPPSRMAKPRPSSMAMGWMSWTVISVVSPGMTISVPSGRVMTPVTSVVRK